MSEPNESSYYEIALTHRQVVVSFVVLLVFVLAVFLCGVWVGRNGEEAGAPRLAEVTQTPVGVDELANMEEGKFFSESEGTGSEGLTDLLDEPNQGTTLAQDIGASSGPSTGSSAPQEIPPRAGGAPSDAPPPAAPPVTQTAPPVTAPIEPPRPASVTPAPPSGEAAGESFVIQVFVSREEDQAKKVRQQLVADGLKAFLSPVDVGGQTMHRVRIGPFTRRDRAESVARNVKRKFRLDTWVTAAGN